MILAIHFSLFFVLFVASAIWLFRQPDMLIARYRLALPLMMASLAILISFNSFYWGSVNRWHFTTFFPLVFMIIGRTRLKRRLDQGSEA